MRRRATDDPFDPFAQAAQAVIHKIGPRIASAERCRAILVMEIADQLVFVVVNENVVVVAAVVGCEVCYEGRVDAVQWVR